MTSIIIMLHVLLPELALIYLVQDICQHAAQSCLLLFCGVALLLVEPLLSLFL